MIQHGAERKSFIKNFKKHNSMNNNQIDYCCVYNWEWMSTEPDDVVQSALAADPDVIADHLATEILLNNNIASGMSSAFVSKIVYRLLENKVKRELYEQLKNILIEAGFQIENPLQTELFNACKANNYDEAKKILEILKTGRVIQSNKSPLYYALRHVNEKLGELLVNYGATTDGIFSYTLKARLFFWSCRHSWSNVIVQLIKERVPLNVQKVSLDIQDENKKSALDYLFESNGNIYKILSEIDVSSRRRFVLQFLDFSPNEYYNILSGDFSIILTVPEFCNLIIKQDDLSYITGNKMIACAQILPKVLSHEELFETLEKWNLQQHKEFFAELEKDISQPKKNILDLRKAYIKKHEAELKKTTYDTHVLNQRWSAKESRIIFFADYKLQSYQETKEIWDELNNFIMNFHSLRLLANSAEIWYKNIKEYGENYTVIELFHKNMTIILKLQQSFQQMISLFSSQAATESVSTSSSTLWKETTSIQYNSEQYNVKWNLLKRFIDSLSKMETAEWMQDENLDLDKIYCLFYQDFADDLQQWATQPTSSEEAKKEQKYKYEKALVNHIKRVLKKKGIRDFKTLRAVLSKSENEQSIEQKENASEPPSKRLKISDD